MASKKSNNKNNNTIKKNPLFKFIAVILIIVGVLVVGYSAYNLFTETSNYREYVSAVEDFEGSIKFTSITEDIELPTEYNGIKITWTSSDSDYLTISGKVTQPEYTDGDKVVTLTATLKYDNITRLYDSFKDQVHLDELSYTFKITVKAKEASNLDKINEVLDSLYLPSETYESINFNTNTCYDGLTLTFTSNNKNVLSDSGVVTHPESDTEVKVTVTAKINEEEKSKEVSIVILKNDYSFETINENLDSFDTNTKYVDHTLNNVNAHNAMIVQSSGAEESAEGETNEFPHDLKLRTNGKADPADPAYFETKMLVNPLSFSFNYIFDDASHTTEKSYFNIYLKENDEYVLLEKKTIQITEDFLSYSLDLSSYNQVQIKVEFNHEWKSDSFVRIDNIQANCKISKSDLSGIVIVPSSINHSILLPFTTRYGGSVTWVSSDTTKLSNNGTLVENASGKVSLTATITYGTISFTESYEIDIKKVVSGSKDPLEIYFIDLGTYGLSDCGECTYIRYNDIDIIVDGGDHFETTTRSICEVFESHTMDKTIDYMVITHPDSDHIGGLPVLFENYQVNTVYKFQGEEFTTQKFKNLKAAYDSEPNCTVYDVYSDIFVNKTISETLTLSDDIYIKFINTGFLTDKETNGRSVVFELYAYDTKVLMTGDADNGGSHTNLESSYMNQIDDIDILKVCHHGTENGTTTEFLNQVKPEVAVICNGNYLGNKHGHPCKGTLNRLNSYGNGIKIYAITGGGINAEASNEYAYRGSCTLEESKIDRNGTITCVIDNTGYTFTSSLQDTIKDIRESQYWDILFGN